VPTFLTNKKMAPALAARVEASVGGDKSPALVRALLRFGIAFGLVALVVWALAKGRESGHILERERASLLEAQRTATASLGDGREALGRDEGFIERLAGSYDGDLVPPELQGPTALHAVLVRPLAYVRGPIDELRSSAGIDKAASTSFKDAFLFCLLDPPRSRTESVLLAKVRVAYTNPTVVEEHTRDAYRLTDAYRGLRMLDPSWEARARAARDLRDVTTLRAELDRTPIEQAKRVLHAQVLVIAVDEVGEPGAVAELDGERAHDLRVEIVDLMTKSVLLRERRHVDPAVWSSGARVEYASGLDSCAVGFDMLTL
jgi:hypothetical protein